MKEFDKVVSVEFRIHESKEGSLQKSEYDHDFLRKLIDNSVINTFGILEACKIQYDIIINNPNSRDFLLRTNKKYLSKVLTGIILINSDTEEELRIKLNTFL